MIFWLYVLEYISKCFSVWRKDVCLFKCLHSLKSVEVMINISQTLLECNFCLLAGWALLMGYLQWFSQISLWLQGTAMSEKATCLCKNTFSLHLKLKQSHKTNRSYFTADGRKGFKKPWTVKKTLSQLTAQQLYLILESLFSSVCEISITTKKKFKESVKQILPRDAFDARPRNNK